MGTMSVIKIRDVDTPNIQAERGALTARFAKDFGPKIGAELEDRVRSIVEKAVQQVSGSKAILRNPDIVRSAVREAERLGAFKDVVLEHPEFHRLIEQTVMEYPLVHIGATGTFTTQHLHDAECKMLALAMRKSKQHVLSDQVVRNAIATKKGISEEQIAATIVATQSEEDVTCIEGTAGAGKSFTMEAVCNAYESSGYEVMGTAISWVASTVLGQSARIKNSRALTGLLDDMAKADKNNAEFFNRPTVVVVDEAGMVGTEQMAELLGYCAKSRYPVKVILTGDSLQVMPIAAGAALETIVAYTKGTRINTIRRQVLESHRTAVMRLSRRESGAALASFVQQEAVRWAKDDDDQVDMVVRDFLAFRLAHPDRTALALATTNEAVNKINTRLRQAYKRLGLIQEKEVLVEVTDTRSRPAKAPFSVGDEIVLRGNNRTLPVYKIDPKSNPLDESTWELSGREGVFNRNNGRIVGIRQAKDPKGSYDFIVDLAGEMPGRIIVNSVTFHKGNNENIRALPMVHNFATTIYGSQGQTVDQVFFLDSPNVDFRYAYVGLSRHRHKVNIYLNEADIHRRLNKDMGKRKGEAEVRNPDGTQVKLGQHTRQAMLNCVAAGWAKDTQNMTAMLHERRYGTTVNKGRNRRLEEQEEINRLGEVRLPSRSESNLVWDADLLSTVHSEVDNPLSMAQAWQRNVKLDTDSMITAVKNMLKMTEWLHAAPLTEECQKLLTAMESRRPTAGIWDLAGAEDLAAHMEHISRECKEFLNQRDAARSGPSLAQEIMDRTRAGDPLTKLMQTTVQVITETMPTLDIEKILNMDHPLAEAEEVRPFEVDLHRNEAVSVAVAEVVETAPPAAAPEKPAKGLLGRWLAHFEPPAEVVKPTAKKVWSSLREADQPDPFGAKPKVSAAVAADPDARTSSGKISWRAPLEWLLRPPAPTKAVPWKPTEAAIGSIEQGVLRFTNVPSTTQEPGKGASDEFLKAIYGTCWGRGALDEPRIFARDGEGTIVSRYSLDGKCVASSSTPRGGNLTSGMGYPPMLRNPHQDAKTPIYILPGPHELFWLTEIKLKKADETGDKASIPHMIWAAKDVDWSHLAKGMAQREVVIVRSKVDPTQAEWAAALQQELETRWRVKAKVTPSLGQPTAENQAAQATAPAPRQVVRPRVR